MPEQVITIEAKNFYKIFISPDVIIPPENWDIIGGKLQGFTTLMIPDEM